ncbi:conjugal transfer protein [Streptomyces sp. NPDC006475]|uniref:conjugal transfer protein n=1 Tax=Streptomyces sp. NPDC006475 TaxID=3155719 RepID=UPI0033B79B56
MNARTSRRPPAADHVSLRTPPTTALPALRSAHRRLSLLRVGVWTAVAAGPAALVLFCAMPRSAAVAAQTTPPAPADTRTGDPAGIAVLFCDMWLRSDAGAGDSAAAQAVRTLAPDVELPKAASPTRSSVVQSTTAVRSVPLGGGRWSVVVAARFSAAGPVDEPGAASSPVRYFAVPVFSDRRSGGAGAFAVTAAPAQVAAPTAAKTPASPFTQTLPADGPLSNSLADFFRAYLAGVGDIERYLSPGTRLDAVPATGYVRIAVDEVSATSETAAGPVPADGTTSRVRARVTATDSTGARWPLAYELTVTARSGRWDITSLHAGSTHTARSSPSPTAGGTAR